MASPYRFLEHTGEVALVASGRDLAEAMAGAAQGLFAVMVDLRGVRVRRHVEVVVESTGVESLAVEWLNELLLRSESEGMLFRRFEVKEATDTRLRTRCGGEPHDPQRHRMKLDVKAATYHQTQVRQDAAGCSIRVILDV